MTGGRGSRVFLKCVAEFCLANHREKDYSQTPHPLPLLWNRFAEKTRGMFAALLVVCTATCKVSSLKQMMFLV